jgi:hypothetical protein
MTSDVGKSLYSWVTIETMIAFIAVIGVVVTYEMRPLEMAPRLDGVSYTEAPRTVVIFVRSNCHFCSESMPFYRELAAARSHGQNFRLVVASDEAVQETNRYLAKNDLAVDRVCSVAIDHAGVSGTPTIWIVDDKGALLGRWLGRQSPQGVMEINSALNLRS